MCSSTQTTKTLTDSGTVRDSGSQAVYVVMAEAGRWEEWSHWVAGVYLDEEEARAAVEAHTEENRKAEADRTAYWEEYRRRIAASMRASEDAEGKRRIEEAVIHSLGREEPPWGPCDEVEYSIEEIPIGFWGSWS